MTTAAGGWGAGVLDVDDDYAADLAERRAVLAADPTRCQELPHMRVAAWDALTTLLPDLAAALPGTTVLDRDGDRWTWRNELLGTARTFTVGDDDSLPEGPLAFLGSQIQEDVVLLDQREGALWADAGLVTFAADWSMGFRLRDALPGRCTVRCRGCTRPGWCSGPSSSSCGCSRGRSAGGPTGR